MSNKLINIVYIVSLLLCSWQVLADQTYSRIFYTSPEALASALEASDMSVFGAGGRLSKFLTILNRKSSGDKISFNIAFKSSLLPARLKSMATTKVVMTKLKSSKGLILYSANFYLGSYEVKTILKLLSHKKGCLMKIIKRSTDLPDALYEIFEVIFIKNGIFSAQE